MFGSFCVKPGHCEFLIRRLLVELARPILAGSTSLPKASLTTNGAAKMIKEIVAQLKMESQAPGQPGAVVTSRQKVQLT